MKYLKHFWTKDEIKKVANVWESTNPQDLADDLKIEHKQLMYMVKKMRDVGFKLTKKRKVAYINTLLNEVMSEMSHAKNKR